RLRPWRKELAPVGEDEIEPVDEAAQAGVDLDAEQAVEGDDVVEQAARDVRPEVGARGDENSDPPVGDRVVDDLHVDRSVVAVRADHYAGRRARVSVLTPDEIVRYLRRDQAAGIAHVGAEVANLDSQIEIRAVHQVAIDDGGRGRTGADHRVDGAALA